MDVEVSIVEVSVILAAIVVLLILSAFFNASETALTAASRARMHALEQEGNSKARLVNRLLRQPAKMIGAVLLGNTLVDVLAASLASGVAVVMVGPAGVVYATAIVTLLIVIFSAVLPKTYALAFSDSVALFVAPIMRVVIVAPQSADRGDPVHRPADPAADAHQARRRGQHPGGARGDPRHHPAANHRRRRRQGRCGDARRRARSAQPAGARHHGPSHQDADDRHRRSPREGGRRGAEKPAHPHPPVEGRAREHRRRRAHQGPAGRACAAWAGTCPSST